jgi:hypothetical protein
MVCDCAAMPAPRASSSVSVIASVAAARPSADQSRQQPVERGPHEEKHRLHELDTGHEVRRDGARVFRGGEPRAPAILTARQAPRHQPGVPPALLDVVRRQRRQPARLPDA